MIVWGVFRGKEFHGLWATRDLAQRAADASNELFPRGKRYEATEVRVRSESDLITEAS